MTPDRNEREDKLHKVRNFIISSLVCFLITGVICGIIIAIEYWGLNRRFTGDMSYVIWIDALTLSGGFMGAFYLLSLLTNQGVFDALVYSCKLVWVNTFHRNVRETKLAKTFADYREEKNRSRKTNLAFMVVGAAPYLLTGLILMIPYYTIFR